MPTMSNLTITIDDDLLRAARVKALQQGTSVNEVCRRAITAFAQEGDEAAVARAHAKAQAFRHLTLSIARPAGSASAWNLSRDEMYEEMFAEQSAPTKPR